MTAKTRRIEMRADPDSEERIALAAAAMHLSISAFVLSAAINLPPAACRGRTRRGTHRHTEPPQPWLIHHPRKRQ